MPTRIPSFRPPNQHATKRQRDRQRGTAHERGYTALWQKVRVLFLSEHPLCVECERQGKTTVATVVDHVVPHKGDMELFWDQDNWRSLCKRHHDQATVQYDGGFGRKVKPKGEQAGRISEPSECD